MITNATDVRIRKLQRVFKCDAGLKVKLCPVSVLQVNREILSQGQIDFCSNEAMEHFTTRGIQLSSNDGTGAPARDFGGLSGGAFYDRTQNTLLTPANIFWARFNRLRSGGSSMFPFHALKENTCFDVHYSYN